MTSLPYSKNLTENNPSESPSMGISQAWLEPRLVVVTLVALISSLVLERLEAPSVLILFANVSAYIAGGFFGAIGAWESIRERRMDVDLLMILAALGAAAVNQWHEGAMLLFLFSLSNVLQDYAIGRSRQAIKSLLKLYPNEARVRRGAGVETIQTSAIRVGDVVLIQPGERIPVDGVIVAGSSAVDEAAITGESMPVEKGINDKVFAGTLNQQGALDVRATQQASDTMLAKIIQMVEEAQDSKAPTERFLERFEQYYATFIIVGVIVGVVVPPLLGWTDFTSNFYRMMILMTVASPCALVISTPASFLSAIAAGARRGVLFKGGAYLEGLAAVRTVAFDKTGTLTTGKITVTDVQPFAGHHAETLLQVAAAAESRSEHPLAKAVVKRAEADALSIPEISDFQAVMGRGVTATLNDEKVTVGSARFFDDATIPTDLNHLREDLEAQGKTVMLVRHGEAWLGAIALADQLRPEALTMIQQLKAQGIRVAMLTGDNARVAETIAQQAGVDDVRAELLPQDKVQAITDLQAQYGHVAMVGDGVNDAPALANADIGIAMGAAGSDVALETADLVLMGDRLELIPFAIGLSKKARRVVWQNITFAIVVIVILIISTFVAGLSLPLGVLGHEGSTVIVVLNGLLTLLILPEIRHRRARKV